MTKHLTVSELELLRAELEAESARLDPRPGAEIGSTYVRAKRSRDALERIDAGTYGRCQVCGEPIPFGRLEGIPDAQACMSCSGSGSELAYGGR